MAHIILADDDPVLGEFVSQILASEGHVVGWLTNGREAVAAIRAKKPNLVLLDCNMPELSGIEVLRALRTWPDTQRIPVMMLTGRRGKQDVQVAYYHGADGYLKKPFSADELLFRVDDLVGTRTSAVAR